MDKKQVIINNLEKHLIDGGYSPANAKKTAINAYHYFESSVGNSRDPYKDTLEYAAGQAHLIEPKVKFKKPKKQRISRKSRPQEAFDFK